jgi:hypothetical protein
MQYITLIFHCAVKRLAKPYNDDLEQNIITLEFDDEAWISFSDLKIRLNPDTFESYINSGYNKMNDLLTSILKYHREKQEKQEKQESNNTL